MTTQQKYRFGDRVRHRKRPEWGIGSIVRVEETSQGGQPTQRLSIRFPNVGLKTVCGLHADLEVVVSDAPSSLPSDDRPGVAEWDRMKESGWLTPMAQRKIEEVMISLPMEVRDPFNGLRRRLQATLALYRFDRSGRGLIDWAIAQSGLDDPLSRFSRQELEQHFDRWVYERDNHLRRLLEEAGGDAALVLELVAKAPPAGRDAVRRLTNGR